MYGLVSFHDKQDLRFPTMGIRHVPDANNEKGLGTTLVNIGRLSHNVKGAEWVERDTEDDEATNPRHGRDRENMRDEGQEVEELELVGG